MVACFVLIKSTAPSLILRKSLPRSDLFPWTKFLEVELLILRDSTLLSLLITFKTENKSKSLSEYKLPALKALAKRISRVSDL